MPSPDSAEPGSRPRRPRDAEATREALLDAAEEVFARHGFDGARIDAIAAAAHYNKSLIFQYFEDKLGLYAEVIRRADNQTRALQTRVVAALLEDDKSFDPARLKSSVETFIGGYFDYLIDRPQVMRIYLWEMAEGWQTYAKIISQRDLDDIDEIEPVLDRLRKIGLLRSDFNPIFQVTSAIYFCVCTLALRPLAPLMFHGKDLAGAADLARARRFVIDFVAHGLLTGLPDAPPQ